MIHQLEQPAVPELEGAGLRIGVLVPRYNLHTNNSMFSRAYEVLTHYGVEAEDIHVLSVPNFYKLATVVQEMLARDAYDAIICFGAASDVISNLIQDSVAQGFQWVAFYHDVPVIFSRPGAENTSLKEQIERGADYARTAVRVARNTRMSKVS